MNIVYVKLEVMKKWLSGLGICLYLSCVTAFAQEIPATKSFSQVISSEKVIKAISIIENLKSDENKIEKEIKESIIKIYGKEQADEIYDGM